LRAIVVDDDVMSRDIFSRYASSWGVVTSVAETAEEGLVMMREASRKGVPFGLAIIDLRMPEMNGLELAAAVKADSALSATELLLVTAYDGPEQGEGAIRAGFSAYLTKPVRQSQLYDAIVGAVYGRTNHETNQGAATLQPAMLHGERILLVEDNEVNRQVFLRQLERLGYRAQHASDGREALERIAAQDFDLVFMDCQMPVMDGFQSARAIRKIETRTGHHVPIIALTANALAGDRDACLAAGMDDYLSKPASLTDISQVLTRWLPSSLASAAPLDVKRLTEIFGSGSKEISEFLAGALPSIRERCERLVATADRAKMLELAHEVKGAAGNLGADELASVAADIESALKAGNGDGLPSADAILIAFARLESAVHSLRIEEPT
jgi:CheY-like chemotaxis protein/HPt (histidine-containing phosphotransfer) domain-containing protein